ncbi:MAG: six-hairpin glycosidase [Chitinophagaceae bacterium]|nr:MAG: six-hairpin glycosidase [Chitinophagaceae bacterium]
MKIRSIFITLVSFVNVLQAQDTVRYTGNTLVNVDYHHGQLSPVVGVHNIQTFRANREHPELAGGTNWTYNHAPMIAYWNNQFYLQFLSNPVGEHVPPGQTFLQTSKDGYKWSDVVILFPPYKIPDGTTKEGRTEVAKDLYAVNHQRMGFYVSKKNRLLTLAYYGIVMGKGDDPNDGKGIGRVVREINKDGSFGPIYFIRYNKTWDAKKSTYPFYTSSKDKGFLEACNELLATPLMMQQWVEEADRDDVLIPLKKEAKAFSYYHLPDGRVVGLWKNALTTISKDEGKSWLYNPTRAPKFVNSNAKIWGQKLSDGKYATVYNPSEFRWPLAISISNDGLNYNNLLLVNGEITAMRYGGAYKSYGPQYVRGITEGNGTPPGGDLWVTYSMNKEDMWVSKIPVPVTEKVTAHANEVFNQLPDGKELDLWNFNSGLWTPVGVEKLNGTKALTLQDWDPFEYAKAERVVPSSKRIITEFTITPQQSTNGLLDIEFMDAKGTTGVRLSFDSTGSFITKAGYRNRSLMKYNAGETYNIKVELNTATRFYYVTVNGKALAPGLFFAPLASIDRVVFRTGGVRRFPDADTPTDQDYDLPNAGEHAKKALYSITSFKTSNP